MNGSGLARMGLNGGPWTAVDGAERSAGLGGLRELGLTGFGQWLSVTTDRFTAAHLLGGVGLNAFAGQRRAPDAAAQFSQPLAGFSAAPQVHKLVPKKRKNVGPFLPRSTGSRCYKPIQARTSIG